MKFFIVNSSDIGKSPKLAHEYTGAANECRAIAVINAGPSDSIAMIQRAFDEWVIENQMSSVVMVDIEGAFFSR